MEEEQWRRQRKEEEKRRREKCIMAIGHDTSSDILIFF
jgi:hypothetical protein